ncbi:hypothetical protein [Paenibacillus sp. PAMC 26794]|uniref:hypothetical protein n=1 Tax=Paenibacillus sp. PAMC 26794 TaxID=1257080 RepID=UPI00037AB167|nr:hypothetical protein [Paenibacillus sp. PAMC 26794]
MGAILSKWVQYYRRNNQNLKYIHWDDNYKLTTNEREIIIKLIQQFQLGENSEGKHLIKRAQEYVHQTQDQDYYEALIEFIKEEQRHARDLGRFMKVQGIPLLRRHWVDNVFRRCNQILSDEEKHVQFQSETLHKFAQNRNVLFNRIVYILRRILFEGTLIVVWYQHKPVFKAGGYKLKSYYYECRNEFNLAKKIIANSQ